MIKVVTTLRKKNNMSTEDFRDYYERKHRLIGEKYLSGYAIRYVRRYMNPITQIDGTLLQPEFDVLLEIWFQDESTFLACGQRLNEPEVAQEIIDDEAMLFDHGGKRSYIVEECESLMN
jgi:hypothetical protein